MRMTALSKPLVHRNYCLTITVILAMFALVGWAEEPTFLLPMLVNAPPVALQSGM